MVIKGRKKKREEIPSLFMGSTSSILKVLYIYIFTLTLLHICNPCSFIYRLFEPYQEHRFDEHWFSEVEAAFSNVSMYWPLSQKPTTWYMLGLCWRFGPLKEPSQKAVDISRPLIPISNINFKWSHDKVCLFPSQQLYHLH